MLTQFQQYAATTNADKQHCQLAITKFIWKCFTGMRRPHVGLLVLKWLRHVGMGPGEGGKQQADKHKLSPVCALQIHVYIFALWC